MNTTSFVACMVAFGAICFGAGALIFAVGCVKNSHDIYEITTPSGARYWLRDVAEVEAALKVDGLLAVRRLRVLT